MLAPNPRLVPLFPGGLRPKRPHQVDGDLSQRETGVSPPLWGPQPGPQGPLPVRKGDRDSSPRVTPKRVSGGLWVGLLCCVCTLCYGWRCPFRVYRLLCFACAPL